MLEYICLLTCALTVLDVFIYIALSRKDYRGKHCSGHWNSQGLSSAAVQAAATEGWPPRETGRGDRDGQVARPPTTFQSLRASRAGTTLSQVPGTQPRGEGPSPRGA